MCLSLQRAVHLWYEMQGRDVYLQEMRIVSAVDDSLSHLLISSYLSSLHVWSTFMALMETEGFPPILTPLYMTGFSLSPSCVKQLFVLSVVSEKTLRFKSRRPLNGSNNICMCSILLTLMMKVVGLAASKVDLSHEKPFYFTRFTWLRQKCVLCPPLWPHGWHQLSTSLAIDNLQIHHVFVVASLRVSSLPTSIMYHFLSAAFKGTADGKMAINACKSTVIMGFTLSDGD